MLAWHKTKQHAPRLSRILTRTDRRDRHAMLAVGKLAPKSSGRVTGARPQTASRDQHCTRDEIPLFSRSRLWSRVCCLEMLYLFGMFLLQLLCLLLVLLLHLLRSGVVNLLLCQLLMFLILLLLKFLPFFVLLCVQLLLLFLICPVGFSVPGIPCGGTVHRRKIIRMDCRTRCRRSTFVGTARFSRSYRPTAA
jgi:hypothetical protein